MKKETTKAITIKQAWCCKQKTPKYKGTKLRKGNKFPAYFEPVFPFSSPWEHQKILRVGKGNGD